MGIRLLLTILLVFAIQIASAVGEGLGTVSSITKSLCKTGTLWSYCSVNSSNALTSTELSFLVFHWQHSWAFHLQDELLLLILYYQLVKTGRNVYTCLSDMTRLHISVTQLKIIKLIFFKFTLLVQKKNAQVRKKLGCLSFLLLSSC